MQHGGNIYKYAKELACLPEEILDFSSNINLYQPEFTLELDPQKLARYPQTTYPQLTQTIADTYTLQPQNITLYNGATSAIYALMDTLKEKKVFLYAPLYGEYEKAALKAKKDIYKINRIEDIDAKVDKKSIVVFVNPATPEGSYYDIKELFLEWKKRKCSIIIDESFIEFENHTSLRQEIYAYKKLYIVHSFSKFYSCAGVRIGALFSHKKNKQKLQPHLWNLSYLDTLFLTQRLQDTQFINHSHTLHQEQKQQLKEILTNTQLFTQIVESDANFILVQSPQAEELFEHLLAHKILVRVCGSFDFLDNSWLRFGVKNKQMHATLQHALKTFQNKVNNL
jgi:threonine-phosphate decarboxylase